MKNLVQIKLQNGSRQINIEPALKSNLLHPIDDQKDLKFRYKPSIAPYWENNFNLANIMNQIIQKKPQSATSTPHRLTTRTNNNPISTRQFKPDNQCPSSNKITDFSISKANKQQNMEQGNQKQYKLGQKLRLTTLCFEVKSQQKKRVPVEYKQLKLLKANKKYQLQTLNSQVRLKSINNKHRTVQMQSIKQRNTQDSQKERLVRIIKRKSEHLIPKSKISIKNFDSNFIQNKLQDKLDSIQRYQKHQNNFTFFKNDNSININLQSIKQVEILKNNQGRQSKKAKRSNTDDKIPDFIKVSLLNYNQEPEYNMEEYISIKKEIQAKNIQEEQRLNEETKNYQLETEKQLFANKIRLLSKENKRINYSTQLNRQKQQIMQSQKPKKPKKQKNKLLKQNKIQQICPWQQTDPQAQQNLYFKL